jgi:hypothetical protein
VRHNAKEFDIPFLARRMIINQIALPDKLNLFGKKPCSASGYAGIMEVWDYKHYTSLKLMCKVLLTFSKGDIDGSQVGHVFM